MNRAFGGVIFVLAALGTGCASHVASLRFEPRLSAGIDRETEQAAIAVAEQIARKYGLRTNYVSGVPLDTEDTRLIADFQQTGAPLLWELDGSYARLHLRVWVSTNALEFVITDYTHGHETPYATAIRADLERAASELLPTRDWQVRSSDHVVRTLPP